MYTFLRVSPHHDFLLFHLLFHLLFSSLLFSSLLSLLLLFSSLLLSCLSSYIFSCLVSSSRVSVCWWVCVSSCVFVWCCVAWCGVCRVVWHAENPVCRLKTLSCVDSKRPRVCRQHAHMLFSMCAGTHGDVLDLHTESVLSLHMGVIASSAYQEQPT